MSFVTIDPTRIDVDSPLSADLFTDIVGDLNFLNGVNTSSVDAGGAPLILNGSFEAPLVASSTTPSNWTFVAGTGGTGVDTNSDQNHGAQSFKFTRDNTGGHSGGTLTGDFFNCSPSLRYQFRFMMKSSHADIRNKVVINWYDKAQGALSSTTIYDDGATPTSPTSWTVFGILVTPVANAMFGKVVITGGDSSVTPAATTSAFFDGFSMIVKPVLVEQTVYTANNTLTVPAGTFFVKARMQRRINLSSAGYCEKTFVVKPGDSIVFSVGDASFTNTTLVHTPSGTTLTVNLSGGTATGGSINFTATSFLPISTGTSMVSLEY